jgi:trk system potassium uptake protein TrkA
MRVVIVGCGRVGALLAGRLDEEGHETTVVDRESAAFERLPQSYKGGTLLGNGIDIDVLRSAGLDQADAFFTLTDGDNRNIMAAQIAREIFGVERVICKINDPIRAQTYRSRGLLTWSRTTILTELLLDMLLDREDGSALLDRARHIEAVLSGDVVEQGTT